jgi:cation transport ATPase
MKKNYKVEVDCAACALKMEEVTKKTEGVKDAAISFMTQKMKIEFEDGADVEAVMKDVTKACKKVEPDCEIFL